MTYRILQPIDNLWPGYGRLPDSVRKGADLFFAGYKSDHEITTGRDQFAPEFSERLTVHLSNPCLTKTRSNWHVSLRYQRGLGTTAEWLEAFGPTGMTFAEAGYLLCHIDQMHNGHGTIYDRYAVYDAPNAAALDKAMEQFHARVVAEIMAIATYIKAEISACKPKKHVA